MIYLDSSALLKLVLHHEYESSTLRSWLQDSTGNQVSSELARVEVIISTRRLDAASLPVARAVLAGLDLVKLSSEILDIASEIDMKLRSLDALHLASAMRLGDNLSTFVAYDHRLLEAAGAVNIPTVSPGRDFDF